MSASSGSSPLARGLRPATQWVAGPGGIIPARAGFTAAAYGDGDGSRDHPRSRGVYHPDLRPLQGGAGSSPLARGLHTLAGGAGCDNGIIPARAGFTSILKGHDDDNTDHPRSRGVYSAAAVRDDVVGGSSPLARGLRPRLHARIPGDRIIPARAGFTCSPTRPSRRRTGSSPLARGLPAGRSPTGRPVGIIPARAGFTLRICRLGFSTQDHPRSRGVYRARHAPGLPHSGSSPLARGLHRGVSPRGGRAGIIPARAGFTVMVGVRSHLTWDHPRSRGVYGSPVRARCT